MVSSCQRTPVISNEPLEGEDRGVSKGSRSRVARKRLPSGDVNGDRDCLFSLEISIQYDIPQNHRYKMRLLLSEIWGCNAFDGQDRISDSGVLRGTWG